MSLLGVQIKVHLDQDKVSLILKREVPARVWPSGHPLEWETFVFPGRCWREVIKLGRECVERAPEDRAAATHRTRFPSHNSPLKREIGSRPNG